MGRPHGVRMTPRMVIAVVATLITCLALLATQLEFDHRDPHEFIHHNRPHPRHTTPPPQRKRVKGENVLLKIQNKLVATTDAPYVCVSLDWWPDSQNRLEPPHLERVEYHRLAGGSVGTAFSTLLLASRGVEGRRHAAGSGSL